LTSEAVKHNSLLNEEIYIKILPSGLKCYIIPKRSFVQKQAVICVNYGSVDTRFVHGGREHATPAGVAHFIEHKLFDKKDTDIFTEFSRLGGSVNAFTNFVNTAYYFSCTENFANNLNLLLEFTQNPYFTDENVEKEKGIITQEIRMYQDNPFWALYLNTIKGLYSKSPILDDIAGTEDDVNAITKETLLNCYDAFYFPGNMALICTGDVDIDETLSIAGRGVKPNPFNGSDNTGRPNRVQRVYAEEPDVITRAYTETDMPLARPMFTIGFKDTDFEGSVADRIASARILADYVCGESSGFFNGLYAQGLIDNPFSLEYMCSLFFGTAMLGASAGDPQKVCGAVIAEFERVRGGGLLPERLELIRRKHVGRFVRVFDSVDGVGTGMVDMFSKDIDFFDLLKSYKTMDAEYLEKRLARLYTPDNYTLSVVSPR